MHGPQPYDPVKAHEYYVKNRQLKGRKTGSAKPAGRTMMRIDDTFSVEVGTGKKIKLNSKQLAEQKAYAAHRVAQIQKKLTQLNIELKKRMAVARQSEAKSKRGPTAAEKSKAARDSKQFRDKHKSELKNKAKAANKEKSTTKPKTDSVEGLKKTIQKVQKSLDAAVQRQRALTAATKNG